MSLSRYRTRRVYHSAQVTSTQYRDYGSPRTDLLTFVEQLQHFSDLWTTEVVMSVCISPSNKTKTIWQRFLAAIFRLPAEGVVEMRRSGMRKRKQKALYKAENGNANVAFPKAAGACSANKATCCTKGGEVSRGEFPPQPSPQPTLFTFIPREWNLFLFPTCNYAQSALQR
ncbi:hypothetical protein J6590_041551 [Homalodisca vitripennis]|nr:hypothetical protein J6590_041551 [Homalodisca vitripennis]